MCRVTKKSLCMMLPAPPTGGKSSSSAAPEKRKRDGKRPAVANRKNKAKGGPALQVSAQ